MLECFLVPGLVEVLARRTLDQKITMIMIFFLVPRIGRDSGWSTGEPMGEPKEGHRPPLQKPGMEGRQNLQGSFYICYFNSC